MPPRWLLLPVALLAMGGVLATYHTFFGRDAGVAMLTLLLTRSIAAGCPSTAVVQVECQHRPVKILVLRASGAIAHSLLTLGVSTTGYILRLAKAI